MNFTHTIKRALSMVLAIVLVFAALPVSVWANDHVEHQFVLVEDVNPSCASNGYKYYVCEVCESGKFESIPALDHDYVSTGYTRPFCTKDGGTTYTCTVCGDSYTDVVPATGHSYEIEEIYATCTTVGYSICTCTTCGKTVNDNYVPALGHAYIYEVIKPTCTESGYTRGTCIDCGELSASNVVPALGHNYIGVPADNGMSVVYTCSHCQDSYREGMATYNKATRLISGSSYVITCYSNGKYYAVSHKNNKLTPIQVSVSNNEVTSAVSADLLWNYSGGKLSYQSNGRTYYLQSVSSGVWGTPTLKASTSGSTTANYSSNKLKFGTYYLSCSGSSFALSSGSATTYMFKQNG